MTNAAKPAVPLAYLPYLLGELATETIRCERSALYVTLFGFRKTDIEAQIAAAHSGAESWTDTRGTIWGDGIQLGGTPTLGGTAHDSCLELYGYVPAPL